jgi:hypothetical protein
MKNSPKSRNSGGDWVYNFMTREGKMEIPPKSSAGFGSERTVEKPW